MPSPGMGHVRAGMRTRRIDSTYLIDVDQVLLGTHRFGSFQCLLVVQMLNHCDWIQTDDCVSGWAWNEDMARLHRVHFHCVVMPRATRTYRQRRVLLVVRRGE